MVTDIFKLQKHAVSLALILAFSLVGTGSIASANMASPETKTPPAVPGPATADTQTILNRASHIVFNSASAVQKQQTISVDKSTAELLKNYMASVVYEPKKVLPSDSEAMDEPWLANTSASSDGMVVPNLDDDEPLENKIDHKLMDVETTVSSTVHSFLKFLSPVQNALVSSPFGFRWGRPHQGIDLAAPSGTPIQAAEDGRVIYSRWKQGYGNFIAVDHGHGYETHYAHCSKLLVHNGQHVHKGQLIAKVGSTGNSTGPHLHFEVVANGVHRNPTKFLNHSLSVVHNH